MLLAGLILAAPLAFLTAFLYFHCFASPDGSYLDPYVGCIGDAYEVFGDGTVHLQTPESYEMGGHYLKVGNKWVSDSAKNRLVDTLRPGIFGIRIISPSNGTDEYLFRRSFAWIPKSWEWIHSTVAK